jgi:Holliday junction resolvase RusA-like endonuclease
MQNKIIIPGPPISYKAPMRTKSGIWFNPNSAKIKQVCKIIKELREGCLLSIGCVYVVTMNFYWAVPKSFNQSKKKAALEGFIIPTKRDGDNCYKFYADCCQGYLWPDDRQIRSGSHFKNYTDLEPRTEIHWIELNKERLAETSPPTTLPPLFPNTP